LSNLSSLSALGLGYNMLYADDPTLITWLNAQDADWADTQTVPPTNLQVTGSSSQSVGLGWTRIPYTQDSGYYEISVATSSGGAYTVHGTTANKSASSYQADNLSLDTTYYFRIRTYTPAHGSQQNNLWSDYSPEVSATTLAPDIGVTPAALSATLAESESTNEILTISNTGTSDLEWQMTANADWLTVTPASGTVAADSSASVSVAIDSSGLSAGTYTDTLTITANVPDENPVTVLVTLSVYSAPIAAFTATPTAGIAPLEVQFTDTSTGNVTSRSWDFGDGSSSIAQNPAHTYTVPGTYTVSLTVDGPGGSDSESKTNYITVTHPAPSEIISVAPAVASQGTTVDVTITGDNTQWDGTTIADFGLGITSTLTVSDATHAVAELVIADDAALGSRPITMSTGTEIVSKTNAFTITEQLQLTDVRLTNVRNTSLTISWLTNLATTGEVHYGSDPSNLNQSAADVRAASTSDDTHFVTLLSLLPDTTYYFYVVSAGVTEDHNGSHYTVTTAPTLALPGNDQIYGQVLLTDSTAAEGTIVYIILEDDNGVGSPSEAAPLSALVDPSGYWFLNLANARTTELSNYFSYSSSSGDQLRLEGEGAAEGRGCQIVETSADSPAEAIVLSLSPCTTTWEIDLDASWNHITLPLAPLEAYSAESVCDEINAQLGSAAEIDRWYASGWDGHICQLPFNDFTLGLGSSYFIKSNTASTWVIEGVEITEAVPLTLQVGWNSIGIPHTDSYTAESLCQEMINQGVTAIEIDRWYASGWDGHICGLPFNNFNLERDRGYFVKSSTSGTVTPSELAGKREALPRQAILPDELPTGKTLPVHDLRISNLRDSSVTLSWLTSAATTAYLRFGEVADEPADSLRAPLEEVASDSRGAETSRTTTHLVVLEHLKPETTYHFEIINSDGDLQRNRFTTAPSLESVPQSDTIYGKVYQTDGVTPATDALLYLTRQDTDGAGLLSAIVDEQGYWHANLGNVRRADGSLFDHSASRKVLLIEALGTDGATASQTVERANDAPAADMILGDATQPTSITVRAFNHASSPLSWLWIALAPLALTILALYIRQMAK
jgi:PKD repeat protein